MGISNEYTFYTYLVLLMTTKTKILQINPICVFLTFFEVSHLINSIVIGYSIHLNLEILGQISVSC